jgi:nitrogen-specific signal transduction histidine kinase/CheY-like chemotaxis protein
MIGTISDITERKSVAEQLLQARKMESIGRLAGGIAHDFNNILTVINGYSDVLLASMDENDPLRLHVAEIRGAGSRASELTHQLLAFSRRQLLELRVINLNELVRQIERWLLRLLGEHVHLSTTLDPGLACVRADGGQMNQVLINLALNARDAMPQGGWLHVQTANVELTEPLTGLANGPGPGRYVQLTVSDNGSGMSEETRRQLFEPFFTTKAHGAGTGLGLATVYGIVQQSGGWITVESQPGEGSTFSIYLPPAAGSAEIVDVPAIPVSRWSRGGDVLLVEDQPGVRGLAARILTGLGFQVFEAASGEQALEIAAARGTPFDLVLTDIVMPGMSGRELVDELKARGLSSRVLYMSGYTDDVLVQYGVNAGAGFLQKPFTTERLAAKVREVLSE